MGGGGTRLRAAARRGTGGAPGEPVREGGLKGGLKGGERSVFVAGGV
jgi:hypothetical protein